jgi:hypothetical protein
MAPDDLHYKGWRIEVLHADAGWKALVYRPSSLLHEEPAPTGPDRHAVMQDARMLVDQRLAS